MHSNKNKWTIIHADSAFYFEKQKITEHIFLAQGTCKNFFWNKLLLASEAHVSVKKGVKLEIRVDNISALKLYQSLGYKPGKIKPAYYQDGCDAMEMIKFFS